MGNFLEIFAVDFFFITDSPFPWGPNDGLDATSIVDDYDYVINEEII